MTLLLFKQKVIGAKKGHELLKKKADALKKAFRDIMIKILDRKKGLGADFNLAMITLAEAQWAAGEFGRNVQDQVKVKSTVRLQMAADNIAGVHLPTFSLRGDDIQDTDDDKQLGLTGGGQAI